MLRNYTIDRATRGAIANIMHTVISSISITIFGLVFIVIEQIGILVEPHLRLWCWWFVTHACEIAWLTMLSASASYKARARLTAGISVAANNTGTVIISNGNPVTGGQTAQASPRHSHHSHGHHSGVVPYNSNHNNEVEIITRKRSHPNVISLVESTTRIVEMDQEDDAVHEYGTGGQASMTE